MSTVQSSFFMLTFDKKYSIMYSNKKIDGALKIRKYFQEKIIVQNFNVCSKSIEVICY